ncbi:AAA family ATPase [Streptomyces sp. KL116D]|uniref:AAA family ATPase n=1 Tax=Streptomyces sp. KL116D TaxID=3045152 RepID=UPI00355791BE
MDNVRPFQRDTADRDGLNRTSPHDADAENYVAGIVMHDRVAYLECAEVLDREDIYQPAVRLIWDTVGGMVAEGKQLHPVTVKAEIERQKRLHEVDGGRLIDRLGAETITAGMAQSFAERIAERAQLRRWDEHANDLKARILGGATTEELDKLADKHRESEQRRHSAHGPSHLTGSLLDWDPFFATDFGNVELLLGGLMAPGQQITIVGDGKAGKSLFTQEWLWRMATGQAFLDDRALHPVPLLYVDAENGHQDIQERFLSYGGGPGRMGLMSYASFPPIRPLDTAGGGADLLAMVAECEAQLVCLDTVSRFISGPENDADTWLSLYRHTLLPLKRAGIASVRLDHLGKDSERGARGSSAKNQDVDHVWELRAQGGGTVVLKRTHTRTGIGPDSFVMLRQYRKHGDTYVPGATRHVLMTYDAPIENLIEGSVAWLVKKLDAMGVPNDAGNPKTICCSRHGRDQGVQRQDRRRRPGTEKPGQLGFPEYLPRDLPGRPSGERSPGNFKGNAKTPGQTFPGNLAGTFPDPGSSLREGKGEGTPATDTTDTPLCTVCEHPLTGYRLDRGYTTHLACDPETGSHPPDQDDAPHDAA